MDFNHVKQIEHWKDRLSFFSDERFLDALAYRRGRGRNDYSVGLLWDSVFASIACRLPSMEEMRRTMARFPGVFPRVPSSYALSRFLAFLSSCTDEIETLFFRKCCSFPVFFGRTVAISLKDQIHYLWEPQLGIPLLFRPQIKGESSAEAVIFFLQRLKEIDSSLTRKIRYLLGGSLYEDAIQPAWEQFSIRAIIPAKEQKKTLNTYRGALYDEKGVVYCQPEDGKRTMIFAGLEGKRNALKYRCMARHYGTDCCRMGSCSLESGIRIPIALDSRIFTPLPRESYRWNRLYSLYKNADSVWEKCQAFFSPGCNDQKKLLCCRVAAFLLSPSPSSPNVVLDKMPYFKM
jgi:hypothetical protein